MKDITSEADVEQLVQAFYARATKDEQIGHFFEHTDFVKHLPRMYAFWNFILLGKEGYKGSVLEKHLHMALTKRDFERWVFLFTETILANYAGETADMAIQRAQTMAWTFAAKFPEQ